jgi:hypothetical protein
MEGDAEAKLQLPKWRIQKRAPVRAWTRGWMDGVVARESRPLELPMTSSSSGW